MDVWGFLPVLMGVGFFQSLGVAHFLSAQPEDWTDWVGVAGHS